MKFLIVASGIVVLLVVLVVIQAMQYAKRQEKVQKHMEKGNIIKGFIDT